MIDIESELRAHHFHELSVDMQSGLLDAMLGAVDVSDADLVRSLQYHFDGNVTFDYIGRLKG